jgi:probable F420-dependent oxidoreductase
MDVGRVGSWTAQLDLRPAAQAREAAAELDELGFGALWIPEAVGREPISHAAVLLDAPERIVVATGVAVIFNRVPSVAAAAQRLLADDSGGRFLLGLGVSHAAMIEGMLGQVWDRPLARMRDYLDAMDDAFTVSPAPADDPPRVLSALGPRMLELAASRAWGALTYFVPVEHTAEARGHLGDGPMLLVEQAVALEADADVARYIAR